MWTAFLTSLSVAFISEIADKTQLVILGLSLQYKKPFRVFLAALLAHAAMDGVAILIGSYLGFSLPGDLINKIVGAAFILVGIWGFYKLYAGRAPKQEKKIVAKGAFTVTLLTVMLSEFGDKTQIASGLLAAKYLAPLEIFLGFVIGLAVVIGLNVFVGTKIAEKIPRRKIKISTALLFIVFGVVTLAF